MIQVRILQLLSSTAFHGSEAMAAELVKKLHALGTDVEVAVLDNGGSGDAEIFEHVANHAQGLHRIACRRQFDPLTLLALKRLISDRRIDVIHSHKYKTTFYAALLKPLVRFGMVSTYHNWILTSAALRAYALLDKSLARINHFAVGVSTPVTQELRRWVPEGQVVQIDNGIDTDRFHPADPPAALRPSLCRNPGSPLLGFVGRLSVEKAVPDMLQSLREPGMEGVQLAIIGDGPARSDIESLIESLQLADRVQLMGHRRDTGDIYRAIDLLVLPSHIEAFPMVLLEAMATGKPVVATQVGEVARIVDDHGTGLVVPAGQPKALAAAVRETLGIEGRPEEWGRSGRIKVVENFSSLRMATDYLRLYEKSVTV